MLWIVRLQQASKAEGEISITLSGIVISVRAKHSSNAYSSMAVEGIGADACYTRGNYDIASLADVSFQDPVGYYKIFLFIICLPIFRLFAAPI